MKRNELEHIIRASGNIAEDEEIVIIGSQAILGQFPEASSALLRSVEADVYPKHYPERADLIDGTIGELSPFHQSFGYYAHGVGPETATLPRGWEGRLVKVDNPNTRGIKGLCLEAHDLAVSKLVASREKDLEFVKELIKESLIDEENLGQRLAETEISSKLREIIEERVKAYFK